MSQTPNRIHPILAIAAASVTLVSLVGIAAMTDILPKSHSSSVNSSPPTNVVASMPTPSVSKPVASANETLRAKAAAPQHAHTAAVSTSQASSVPSHPAAPPVAQNSAVGIGVGAVIGGLLGNQVGGGTGKTLATIAGAVGGGYIGNEVAKKNQ